MNVEVAWSTASDVHSAVSDAYAGLVGRLGTVPHFVLLYASATYDWDILARTMCELAPNVPVHGASSCLGVMTNSGLHSEDGFGLGMLGILDPGGGYGVGAAHQGDDPGAAARLAARSALTQAGRPGEVPALLWMTASPGHEEALLEGLTQLLGPHVPVLGGTAADNIGSGQLRQLANGEVLDDGVVVSALFPTGETSFAFHSGYEPTSTRGRVTRAHGREVFEIDGRQAAAVYNEWTENLLGDALRTATNVLPRTTLHPLGRVAGTVSEMPYYLLSHPDAVTPQLGLTFFTDLREGDEVTLMRGTPEGLVDRPKRVALAALSSCDLEPADVAGALVVYCAGCMLAVRTMTDEIARGIHNALDGKPFLGVFTFGEQGCFPGGENRHGNLMISVLLFGATDKQRS